jgi:catechol 2,3-dioxygenase-like lactoylglutathione lyase family enzyme
MMTELNAFRNGISHLGVLEAAKVIDAAPLRSLALPPLGQIGIVVADLHKAVAFYRDTLGVRSWAWFEGEPERCVEGDRTIWFKGRTATALSGGVVVELIQIVEGHSLHVDFLEKTGGGLHHIGYYVDALDWRIAAAKRAGVEVVHAGLFRNQAITLDYCYLDANAQAGIAIELIDARIWTKYRFPIRSRLVQALAVAGTKELPRVVSKS